jgi:hypothetical protein
MKWSDISAKYSRRYLLDIMLCIIVSVCVVYTLKWFYAQLSLYPIGHDFISYWASGRLLLAGQNPYSSDAILSLQRAVGWLGEKPLVMYNPPWTLSFILPFSLKHYVLGKFLWVLFHLSVLIVCADRLWRLYGGAQNNQWINLLILGSYAPVYFMLAKGQIIPLVLLGIVGFLYFESKKKWFCAGLFIGLINVKPHLLFLFYIALFLWVLYQRRWEVLLGAGSAFIATTAIPFIFNSHILVQYCDEIASKAYQYHWATPSFGTLLRLVLDDENHFLQFLPAVIGVAWLLFHWNRTRENWVWTEQMPILLFVSLLTTFYVWANDFVLLIVGIMQASVWLIHYPRHRIVTYSVAIYAIINILAWVTCFLSDSEQWIVWMVPALFVNYTLMRRNTIDTAPHSTK